MDNACLGSRWDREPHSFISQIFPEYLLCARDCPEDEQERQSLVLRSNFSVCGGGSDIEQGITGQKCDKGESTVIPGDEQDGFPREVTLELKLKDEGKLGLRDLALESGKAPARAWDQLALWGSVGHRYGHTSLF